MGRARALNLLALCILVLLGAVGMNAQCDPNPVKHEQPDICLTAGSLNGHWWNYMPKTMKAGFLYGYGEHESLGGEQACGPLPKYSSEKTKAEWEAEWETLKRCSAEWFPETLTVREMLNRLDVFYTPTENLEIGIHAAVHIIGMSVAGKPPSEVEQKLSDERKSAAASHQKKERGTATVEPKEK